MNKRSTIRRIAVLLSAAMLCTCTALPAFAEPEEDSAPAEDSTVDSDTADDPDAADAEGDAPEEESSEETTEPVTEPVVRVTMTAPDTLSMLSYEETADGGMRITAFRWTVEETVTIPAQINGKPVTEIGTGAFKYCYADFVELPDTVTVIGDNAFEGCAYLQAIEIPEGCVSIGVLAFADCDLLETVGIPDSVQEIGYMAFDGTPFYRNQTDDFVILGDGILYAYNGSDTDLEIPDTVKTIGAYACADHQTMKSVTIPASVHAIKDCAFDHCTALAKITAPDYIAELAPDAFANTKWMTGSKEEFLTLGKMLIAYRGKGGEVEVPDGIRVINNSAFEMDNAVTVVRLPGSVEEIRRAAFYRCPSLQVAEFGDGLKSIGDMAFWGCNTLFYLRLGHALESVGDYAFAGCAALTEVYLPDTVQHIGEKAFGYSYDDQKGYLKLRNEMVLYSNTEAVRLYAAAEEIAQEPLPDEENTEPAPEIAAPDGESGGLGMPRGTAWIPAAGLGGLLVLSGCIWLVVKRKREDL